MSKQKHKRKRKKKVDIDLLLYKSLLLMLATLCLWLVVNFTVPKLYKMTQIRGWTEGASINVETISDKDTTRTRVINRSYGQSQYSTSFWIAWNNQAANQAGPHRVNLLASDWEKISVGDTIEIIRLANDNKAYLRDGIFASNGNFVFDSFLLINETTLIIYALLALLKAQPQ